MAPRLARRLSDVRADPSARRQLWHGACACGTVRFLAEADPSTATACICAKCRGMGLKLIALAEDDFRLLTGADGLTEAQEGARTPHHFFCARCGEPVFGRPAAGRVTVNAALLARGDPDAVTGGRP